MLIYVYAAVSVAVSYWVGKNSKDNGYGFWRSFIFMLLLCAVVIAFLKKQFYGG